MNRRDAIKTIGSIAGLATSSRLLSGCLDDDRDAGSFESTAGTPRPPTDPSGPIIGSDAWGTSWTHAVPGRWSAWGYDGLLLYDQATGTASFYNTDGAGVRALPALQTDTWRRHRWTILQSGFFTDSPFSCVLLYDQAAGYLAIFGTDGAGNITSSPIMERHTRTTWTHIIPGWFVDSVHSSIVLYSQSEGHAEVWSSNGGNKLTTTRTYSGWRTSWTKIVGASFGLLENDSDYARTDLFFYEGSTGHAEHWGSDGTGRFSWARTYEGLPTNVAEVFASNFGSGDGVADVAFLGGDGLAAGHLSFRRAPVAPGETDLIEFDQPLCLPASSSLVIMGNFYLQDPEDHWFHDGPLVSNPTHKQKLAIQQWRGSIGGFKSFIAYDREAGVAECWMHQPAPDTSCPLEGYATSTTNSGGATVSTGSVLPGETVSFCVSSAVGQYTIGIHAFNATGLDSVPLATLSGLPACPTPLYRARLAYRDGARWSPVASFTVPTSWKSGIYVAKVQAQTESLEIPFIVRSASPGENKILVVVPDATYEAYNIWGGRSAYGFLATPGNYGWSAPGPAGPGALAPYAFKVAFDRAYHPCDPEPGQSANYRKWLTFEAPLVQWLQLQQLDADYCTCRDLDRVVPSSAYGAVVFPGHHEYWSAGMRSNLQTYNSAGGNTIFLTGNTCWFQVRFDYIHNQMVCYKVAEFDPYSTTSEAGETTTNWHLSPVNDPSPRTTGLIWSGHLSRSLTVPGTAMYEFAIPFEQSSHWAFAGTQLLLHTSQQGYASSFGSYYNAASAMQDSIGNNTELDCLGGSCFRGGEYRGPSTVTTLAEVFLPCGGDPVGAATMCVFNPTSSSRAFNAATYRWSLGLSLPSSSGASGWTAMDQITLNVFDQFLGRENVAAGCPITASSSHEGSGWSTAQLTNGDLAAGYTSQIGENDPSKYSNHVEWLWVQLPSVRAISQVVLYPRRDAGAEGAGFPVSFHIDVWNGTSWITRVAKTNYPKPGSAPQVFTWGRTDSTSYVRVTATSLMPVGNDGYLFQLAELRVY